MPAPTVQDAHGALKKAYGDGRLLVFSDARVVARPGSPVYSALEVFVPPLVLLASSLTLLFAAGLIEWIVALVAILLYQLYGAPHVVHWRAHRRAVAAAMLNPHNLQVLWQMGALAFAPRDRPAQQCVAPEGDWRAFAGEFLVDAEPTQD